MLQRVVEGSSPLEKTIVFGEKNETIEGLQDSILQKIFVDEAKNARIQLKLGKCCLDFNCAVDTSNQASFPKRDHSGGEFITKYQ